MATSIKNPVSKLIGKKTSFEQFLRNIDKTHESTIREIIGDEYIDTPGAYSSEWRDYEGILDYYIQNAGRETLKELSVYFEKISGREAGI